MYTYGDLRNAKAEAWGFSETTSAYPHKIAQVFHQVAIDYGIPIGNRPEDQKKRIEAFRNLPDDTALSPKASSLLEEAIRAKKEFLASTS